MPFFEGPHVGKVRPNIHVIEALWMQGVWSWIDHIQAIHSQRLILRSTKLFGQPEFVFSKDEMLGDEKSMFVRWRGWLFIPHKESLKVL